MCRYAEDCAIVMAAIAKPDDRDLSVQDIPFNAILNEAQEMIASYDSQKMKVLPIKLYKDVLNSPPWIQNIQYLRYGDYPAVQDIIKELIRLAT